MKKILIQGGITIALFFATWFMLIQIDWVAIFKIQKVTDETEEKIGELFWDITQSTENENNSPLVKKTMDSLVTKICLENKIERKLIKIHVLDKDEINAFALPNGHLIVYSGLISNSDNQEELCGVISHEIAHIRLNHVIKKLVSEIGLSVLISMSTGNGNSEAIKAALKMLSSTAFDRSLEKEADIKAVDYLIKAKINPEQFANFLFKLSDKENEEAKYLSWISTHPDSKERANYIIEYSRNKKVKFEAIIANSTWSKIKEKLKE
jgi:predicted Zn-dependent protease